MTRNPDPKPGRWLLPLVVAGLIGFTYVFVNALSPGTVPDSTSTTTSTTTTIAATTTTSTTTTTIPEDLTAFIDEVSSLQTDAAALGVEAETINTEWEDRVVDYGTTGTRLEDLAARTAELVTAVTEAEPPPLLEPVWLEVGDAAAAMQTAADDMVTGLAAPDTGEARRTALEDYETAVADFIGKMTKLNEAASGG